MKKTLHIVALASLVGALSVPAMAESTGEAKIDLVTAYVYRGVILNKGPSIQPSASFTLDKEECPLTFGIWADYTLASGYSYFGGWVQPYHVEKYRIGEIDLTASYAIATDNEDLEWSIGYEYNYFPTFDSDAGDEPFNHELNTILAYNGCEMFTPQLKLAYTYWGLNAKQFVAELQAKRTVELDGAITSIGAKYGYVRSFDDPETFNSYWYYGELFAEASWKLDDTCSLNARVAYSTLYDPGNHFQRHLSNANFVNSVLYATIGVACSF